MEDSKLTSKCHICEQEFSNCDLETHFLKCDQEHKSDFEICDKVFQTVHLLDNHKSIHDESKNVVEKRNKAPTASLTLSQDIGHGFKNIFHEFLSYKCRHQKNHNFKRLL